KQVKARARITDRASRKCQERRAWLPFLPADTRGPRLQGGVADLAPVARTLPYDVPQPRPALHGRRRACLSPRAAAPASVYHRARHRGPTSRGFAPVPARPHHIGGAAHACDPAVAVRGGPTLGARTSANVRLT